MVVSMFSQRKRQGTAPETIAAALRADILSGATRPGTLLRQEDLAARFAMSRIPVRDALRLLEAEGLVTIATNRGAQVKSWVLKKYDDDHGKPLDLVSGAAAAKY